MQEQDPYFNRARPGRLNQPGLGSDGALPSSLPGTRRHRRSIQLYSSVAAVKWLVSTQTP